MNNRKLEKTVQKEIEVLNDRIDEKIIRGLSCVEEARRHRFLFGKLSNIKRKEKQSGWLTRPLHLASMFMF